MPGSAAVCGSAGAQWPPLLGRGGGTDRAAVPCGRSDSCQPGPKAERWNEAPPNAIPARKCCLPLLLAAAMLELLQPLLEPLIARGVKMASEVMRKRHSSPGFGFTRVSGLAKFHCFLFCSLFFKDGQNVSDFSRLKKKKALGQILQPWFPVLPCTPHTFLPHSQVSWWDPEGIFTAACRACTAYVGFTVAGASSWSTAGRKVRSGKSYSLHYEKPSKRREEEAWIDSLQLEVEGSESPVCRSWVGQGEICIRAAPGQLYISPAAREGRGHRCLPPPARGLSRLTSSWAFTSTSWHWGRDGQHSPRPLSLGGCFGGDAETFLAGHVGILRRNRGTEGKRERVDGSILCERCGTHRGSERRRRGARGCRAAGREAGPDREGRGGKDRQPRGCGEARAMESGGALNGSAAASGRFAAVGTAALGALMALLIAVTVAGNALVMLAFVADSSLRTQNNFFLLNLAISDFLVGKVPPVAEQRARNFVARAASCRSPGRSTGVPSRSAPPLPVPTAPQRPPASRARRSRALRSARAAALLQVTASRVRTNGALWLQVPSAFLCTCPTCWQGDGSSGEASANSGW